MAETSELLEPLMVLAGAYIHKNYLKKAIPLDHNMQALLFAAAALGETYFMSESEYHEYIQGLLMGIAAAALVDPPEAPEVPQKQPEAPKEYVLS